MLNVVQSQAFVPDLRPCCNRDCGNKAERTATNKMLFRRMRPALRHLKRTEGIGEKAPTTSSLKYYLKKC